MKTVCAGCNKFLHGDILETENISHGLCRDCLKNLYPEFAEQVIKETEEQERNPQK